MRIASMALALCTLLLCACTGTAVKAEPKSRSYFEYFDTVSFIYSYAGDSDEIFKQRCDAAEEVLRDYHRLFDIYNEYEGVVNLCTINKNAGGAALKADERLVDFLLYAKELYALTNGEMNVMLGSVLSLWHECRELAEEAPETASVPPMDVLKAACEHTDIELLEVDEENNTVRISDSLASIDVGALGKGYAAEMAARTLVELGTDNYLLNIGGNIRCIGAKTDGSDFITGVKDPFAPDALCAAVGIHNSACVTSGIYERYFTVDGVRYHHIIDKDTLQPAAYFASVTVVTENSALADALSTALFCMSREDGLALTEGLGGVDVIWIDNEGNISYTQGLEDRIQLA